MPGSGNTTIPSERGAVDESGEEPAIVFALPILWSADEPWRCGEVAFLGGAGPWWLGRAVDREGPIYIFRQRPGEMHEARPLTGTGVSRRQLRLRVSARGLEVENVGAADLLINGVRTKGGLVSLGDVIEIAGHYLFLVTERALEIPRSPYYSGSLHEFSEPDAHRIVGESATAWALRAEIWAAAKFDRHVLVLGESGSGKELAAEAIHIVSSRARKPFVARNAATLPEGLTVAELFGNLRNYPNGTPERVGLIGSADGGTFFLDEIGELPHELQAPLLRVLDTNGEYQRLGEDRTRRADIRFIGATNRAAMSLKHDLVGRLPLRVEVPALAVRREDIPLLVRQLVLAEAKKTPDAVERFVYFGDRRDEIRIDAALMTSLVRHPYTTNVRELLALLLSAIIASKGKTLALPRKGARAEVASRERTPRESTPEDAGDAEKLSVVRALEARHWNVSQTAESLGVTRDVLRGLMKKHALQRKA